MAFFKKIKAFNRKIETAMVIDKLLKEMSKTPLYRLHIENHNTETLARMMVDGAWANNRDVLTGQFGLMPHRLTAAAFTISRSLTTLEGTNFSDLIPVLSIALTSLLDEIETNTPFYGFNSLDDELISVALKTLAEIGHEKQQTAQPSKKEAAIYFAVKQLRIQLMLCSTYLSDKKNLEHEFVRGYFVGYLDCALQMVGEPINDDEEFFLLLLQGHALLLDPYISDTQHYTAASLKMQDIPLFSEGQQAGGNDYYGLRTGKIKTPLALAMHFSDAPPD